MVLKLWATAPQQACHRVLKKKSNFWAFVAEDAPIVGAKALKILMPFPTSYLCEQTFSTLLRLKSKARNKQQDLEKELRVAIGVNIVPDVKKLVGEMQAHLSH